MKCEVCEKETKVFIFVSIEEAPFQPQPVKWCLTCLGKATRNEMGREKLEMFREMLNK